MQHLFFIQREEDYSKKAKEKTFKVLRALLRASPDSFEQVLGEVLDELFRTAAEDKEVRFRLTAAIFMLRRHPGRDFSTHPQAGAL